MLAYSRVGWHFYGNNGIVLIHSLVLVGETTADEHRGVQSPSLQAMLRIRTDSSAEPESTAFPATIKTQVHEFYSDSWFPREARAKAVVRWGGFLGDRFANECGPARGKPAV